jgi:hypothetical protein
MLASRFVCGEDRRPAFALRLRAGVEGLHAGLRAPSDLSFDGRGA